MRNRVTGIPCGLALAAMLLCCAGCQQWRNANAPVEPRPASYEELESRAAQVQGKPASTTLGTHKAATTARKAYEMYRWAMGKSDFEACWRLLSKNTQDAYEREAIELKMRVTNNPSAPAADVELLHVLGLTRREVDKLDGKSFFIASLKWAEARDPTRFEVVPRTKYHHESVRGDRALVYVTLDGKRQEKPMKLVREGGVWRIDQTRPGTPE